MALILSLETATTVCSVALARDGKLIGLKEVNNGFTHSENLTVFIEEVFKSSGLKLQELDAVAVSKGPGSYTGLRIGVSTAKGLCYALQKPLIAVDTLQSLAACVMNKRQITSGLLMSMIDARRMEVYCATYDLMLNEVIAPEAIVIDEHSFSDLLKRETITFFGDGSDKCKKVFSSSNARFENVELSATGMIQLAEKKFLEKIFEDVSLFEPFYLKEPHIGLSKS